MPFASYFRLVFSSRRFITFGFLMAFSSSFGQTYFVGIFGPSLQAEFGLSHTTWGTIYMLGTLASALVLPWTGKQIDHLNLKHYTLLVCLLLIGACIFMAFVPNMVFLVIAIFLLRQSGQGLMSHTAVTTMARYFDTNRGRAIALASLGFAAGEATLPIMAVLAIAEVGWRWSFGGVAILLSLGLIPAALWLLKGHDQRHSMHLTKLANLLATEPSSIRSHTRSEVLRDPRFYFLMPGILAPSVIMTGMFFHHLNLADAKNWSHSWITGSYVIFALAATLTLLLTGWLIDRFGAVRLVPFMLLPLTLAMVILAEFDSRWIAWLYFILVGTSTGISHAAVSAVWAEIYGVDHLGAIKSLMASLSVLGSALGPVIMGVLMDGGMSIETVCLLMAGYSLIGAVMVFLGFADFFRWKPKPL